MIKVERIIKTFGDTKAVDDISFEVNEGENMVLLGTSGCGKTTTLKIINRLTEPDSGTVYIDDKNTFNQPAEILRRSIGYVLQNNGLFPHYTVAENIAVVLTLLKWDKAKIQSRVIELLEKLHLSKDHLNAYPAELSGGQQQRVGLARALAANPPVLLMDEPFGALDNVTKGKIHTEFKALDELKRKTIIMVTHDVQEAFEIADRITLMDKGKIVQIGTPADLLFNPVNDFVKEFLQEQRLQLEFKTIKLIDVWEYMPDTDSQTGPVTLQHTASVWDALETFNLKLNEQISIRNQQSNNTKSIRFDELMSAFYKYKNQ